jgi:multidrug efflux pump subunit AcrB
MWLINTALRRPLTIVVAVLSIVLASVLAIRQMKVDIFPELGAPAIYVAQPYGGMDPAQMEGFLTYYYEYHFLFITGIEHVESKNIQGMALMKLVFHPDTDMSAAMGEVIGYSNRARAFMPPGAVPPFIMRYDAGSVPVAQLVFTSANRSVGEMQDIALNRVRPIFSTLPGVSAPPPFGGSQRTIVVRADPEKLRQYRLSPEEVVSAVNRASTVAPSGNVRTGDLIRIASTNATLGGNIQELLDAPVRVGNGPAVYLRDVGTIQDTTDIVVGYAHVNGKRTVYIPVTKRADASTLDVIQNIRKALPAMRNVAPEDVSIDMVFDQSGYVVNALKGLITEGVLGAFLTGLMVLVFLRDFRSSLIVVLTIPIALLSAVLGLWLTGQTINIMTLGGLALAVGVLVDEATVEVENIHTHFAAGMPRARAVLEACRKTITARLLSMLCVLAVFLPALFMTGVGRQLFVPLSLAVAFAMLASYILSSTLVPVLSTWLLRGHGHEARFFERLRDRYRRWLPSLLDWRWLVLGAYTLGAALLIGLIFPRLGTEIFPNAETHQLQLRLRAPIGTRLERTEVIALKAMDVIRETVGPANVDITSSFIGVPTPNYPVNSIYLFTSGQHEAILGVGLRDTAPFVTSALKERLRREVTKALPGVTVSFEAGDIVSRVMSFGSPTPIEVAVQGPQLAATRPFAEKVRAELAKVSSLRDLQTAQPLDYPALQIQVDRDRAGQFDLTTADVAKSLVAATSSSRYTDLNFWRDPGSGNGFQIQVEIPQAKMASIEDVENLPVMPRASNEGPARPLVADIAKVDYGTTLGEVDRYNMQRVVSFTANLGDKPLGQTLNDVRDAIRRAGTPPRGVTVYNRGQIPAFQETLSGLQQGLLLSVVVIFLLLAANFQSFRLAFAVISTVPAVICGVLLMLLLTGTTLNVQSFMGAIMAIGISVANAILLVTFAEQARRERGLAHDAESLTSREFAIEGATGRLRAILMTATAMIAGMMPLALGTGDRAQSAPLGRAVIGGLALATLATLTVLPIVYSLVQRSVHSLSPSLHPEDPTSAHYESHP